MSAPDSPTPASKGRCLYVIGMHRSGTSAVTALIDQLGPGGPAEDDLIPATGWNERGNKESLSLSRFNESLLVQLGGGWSEPPLLPRGWEGDPSLNRRRERASHLLATAFGERQFVWKDPRNCIVLPFWRALVPRADGAVFVYRSPSEVAGSLAARDGFTQTHGLALWERYVRSAVANLDGVPTLVTRYERVLEETEQWCNELVAFLDEEGFESDVSAVPRAIGSLDPRLRHQRNGKAPEGGIHASQERVLDLLSGEEGPHVPWSAPDLGEEPVWVEDVLTLRRELVAERRRHQPSMSPLARLGRGAERIWRRPSPGA